MSALKEPRVTSPGPGPINRSPWFLADAAGAGDKVLLLDRFEVPLSQAEREGRLADRVTESLDLSFLAPAIEPDTMEVLLAEQFAAASEYVYGHPFWESVREGSQDALFAYLLETRHYLAAAASRMAASIAPGIGLHPLTLLLSQHLLEEWDHAKFYSDALKVLGCAPGLVSSARPLPATLEWIHATRAIAYKNDLSAAACSGFMEFSSVEIDAVTSWHSMLVERGLLPSDANDAIMEHVDTDVSFGHADNWKHALRSRGPVTPAEAAGVLNDVVTIAEAIYRWLTALQEGASASIVLGMQLFTEEGLLPGNGNGHEHKLYDAAIYSGLPVWPAELMALMNSGGRATREPAGIITALSYAFGDRATELERSDRPLATLVQQHATQLGAGSGPDLASAASLADEAAAWLRAINGHALWDAMVEQPSDGLVIGYVLENYHYLASATRHIGAAVGSCTNPAVRLQLIEHLEDELEHCEMLRQSLIATGHVTEPDALRPLSTTVAFVGFLANVARQDWKAYVLVSTFLQKSLSEIRKSNRLAEFYTRATESSPLAESVLRALWRHDIIDEELGHDDRPAARLTALLESDQVSRDSIEHAAIGPALAWGFLDGIFAHYGNGIAALRQRAGWQG
jgi:pyrroloquinoline quinone (PQQ) biosynthesis protein C